MSNEKELLFEIHGLKFYKDSDYQLVNKPNPDSMLGEEMQQVSVIPSKTVVNEVSTPYDMHRKRFNTGLYPDSTIFPKGMSKEDKKAICAKLEEHLVKPYEEINEEGILDRKNVQFWDEFHASYQLGDIYSTSNPETFLIMYLGVLSGIFMPKEATDKNFFSNAKFIIVDKESAKTRDEEERDLKFEVTMSIAKLEAQNKNAILDIAGYAGCKNLTASMQKKTLLSIVNKWATDKNENTKQFLEAFELFNNPKTKDRIELFAALKALRGVNHRDLRVGKTGIMWKEQTIGTVDKEVVLRLTTTPEMDEIKQEIYTEYLKLKKK